MKCENLSGTVDNNCPLFSHIFIVITFHVVPVYMLTPSVEVSFNHIHLCGLTMSVFKGTFELTEHATHLLI